jgi:hypothetical protein
MTDPARTAYYIATVWFGDDDYDVGEMRVLRMAALDEDDYRAHVRATWPDKVVSFGPVGLAVNQDWQA